MRYFDFMESESSIDNLDLSPGQTKSLDDLNRAISLIRKNCHHYLQIMIDQKSLIYRGIRNERESTNEFIIGNSFNERRPKDSAIESQKLWDRIVDQLGIKAKRSNSIFVTSDRNQASRYGKKYMIFPFNDSVFSWSKTSKDIVLSYHMLSKCEKFNISDNEKEQLLQTGESLTKLSNLVTTEIQMYFNSLYKNILNFARSPDSQILSSIKLGIRITRTKIKDSNILNIFDHLNKLLTEVEEKPSLLDVKKFQSYYNITNIDFAEAINSGHEICISGRYIGIDYQYESIIQKQLLG